MKPQTGLPVKSAVSGLLAGLCNGLLGTGGGMLLVPLLRDWVGVEEKKAMATSVLCILPLSLLSAFIYARNGHIDWQAAWPYLVGGLVGGTLAGRWFAKTPSHWLRRGFGALLLFGGIRMLMG